MRVISEPEFRERIEHLARWHNASIGFRGVTGPGRSGAIAAVYVSHILRVPFLPFGLPVPDSMRPLLVVDTARKSGRTIRKAVRGMGTPFWITAFPEPPRVKFWYEVKREAVNG